MEQWHGEDVTSESISIARCRELLGDEAKNLSDDDVARVRQHACAMADIIIEAFLEQREMQE